MSIEFDLAAREVRRDGKRVWGMSARAYELLLILAIAHTRDERVRLTEVARRSWCRTTPRRMRRIAIELEPSKLVRIRDGDVVALNLVAPGAVRPSRAHLEAALVRLHVAMSRDARHDPRTQVTQARAAIADAENALLQGDHVDALRHLGRGDPDGRITWLLHAASKSQYAKTAVIANLTAAKAAMGIADTSRAVAHVRAVERHADTLPDGDRYRVHAAQTEAAAHRMRAALEPERSGEALEATRSAFHRAQTIATAARGVSEETRHDLVRWSFGEATTVLCLAGNTELADQWIGTATEHADKIVGDGAEAPTLAFMNVRRHLVGGDLHAARTALESGEKILREQTAPPWIRGWQPRYRADVLRAAGGSDAEVRQALRAVWTTNPGWSFQRLLCLARFAVWGIEPVPSGADTTEDLVLHAEIIGTLARRHVEAHGRPARGCPVCAEHDRGDRVLLPRIRCALRIPLSGHGGALDLGMWR